MGMMCGARVRALFVLGKFIWSVLLIRGEYEYFTKPLETFCKGLNELENNNIFYILFKSDLGLS